MIHSGTFRIIVDSARLRLAYERARAPNILSAIHCFIRAQTEAIARIKNLGLTSHVKITELELMCAYAGLGYARPDNAPAWQLSDDIMAISTAALPTHPLIDTDCLTQLSTQSADRPVTAYDAIKKLLTPCTLEQRWQGLSRISTPPPATNPQSRIAVCLHLFYPEIWQTLKSCLDAIPESYDLFISVPEFACTPTLSTISADHPHVYFMPYRNRGRDLLPFLNMLTAGVFNQYDAVCKIHSKRSPHRSNGNQWLEQLLQSLLGESSSISNILRQFRDDKTLGLVGPASAMISKGEPLHTGCNQKHMRWLADRASLPDSVLDEPFFSGTMFWFRPAAMAELQQLKLAEDDFQIEMGQTDGTLAHALERLIWPLVIKSGYRISTV